MVLQLIFAAIFSFIFLISQNIYKRTEKYHEHLLSLSAGMFIALIFIEIFPLLSNGYNLFGDVIFLLVLASFTFSHVIVKYTYQHSRGLKLKRDLGYFHIVGFFFENFTSGFMLAFLINSGISPLIFLPFLLVILVASLSLKHLSEKFRLGSLKYMLSLSVLFGAIEATLLQLSQIQVYILLSLSTGFLLYFVIRDVIPKERTGRPLYFLFGVIAVAIILYSIKIL